MSSLIPPVSQVNLVCVYTDLQWTDVWFKEYSLTDWAALVQTKFENSQSSPEGPQTLLSFKTPVVVIDFWDNLGRNFTGGAPITTRPFHTE